VQIVNSFDVNYVEEFFADAENADYVNFHKYRWLMILNLMKAVDSILTAPGARFLDIGPLYQTNIIRHAFPELKVDTMGYNNPINKLRVGENHYKVDLNHTQELETDLTEHYEIILFAEVLEHLYTKPQIVLEYLKGILKKEGIIILQTPNGISLDKRVKLLSGKNPFHLIEEHRQNHFREYSLQELVDASEEVGFKVEYKNIHNYFNPDKTFLQRLYRKSNNLIPMNLRDGLTVVLRK